VVGKAANWLGEQVLEEGVPGSSWRYQGAGFVKGAGRQLFQRFRFAEGASSSYDNILMELTEEAVWSRPSQGGFYFLEAGEESMTIMVRGEQGARDSVRYYIEWTKGGKEVPAEEFMSRVVKPIKNFVEDTTDLHMEIPVPDSDDILRGYESMGFTKTGSGTLQKIFEME
jgi:hypothetical protein